MKRPRLKRLIGYGLGILGLLLLLIVGAVSLLLYHPDAPRWVLQQVREHSELNLEVERHQGVLAGPLSLSGVRLQGGFGLLKIDRIELDWRPSELWGGQLHIAFLDLSEVHLSLSPASSDQPESPRAGIEGIKLPLGIRIDRLAMQDLLVERPPQEPQRLDRLLIQAWSDGEQLHIGQFDLTTPELALQAEGQLGFASPWAMDLQLNWRYEHPQWPPQEGQGEISGDLQRLQVEQTLSGMIAGKVQARLNNLIENLNWEASVLLDPNELGDWLTDFPLRVGGELRSWGDLEHIGLEADLEMDSAEHGEAALTFKGGIAGGRLDAERLRLETPLGSRLELNGYYEPGDGQGRFDTVVTWRDLRWPLQGEEPQVISQSGQLTLDGMPSDYAYRLNGLIRTPDQPPAEVETVGRGDLRGLSLERWQARFETGQLQGQGSIKWQPAPEWALTFEGEGIDPSLWVEQLPGRLVLSGESKGQVTESGLSAGFRLHRLQGRVRDYPVTAQGRALFDGETLNLSELHLTTGRNQVDVAGEIGRELALDWRIEAPDLQGVWPGLGGELNGGGRLTGSQQAPRLQAALEAEKLGYAELQAEALKLDADLSLAGNQQLILDLTASRLQTPAGNWRQLDLDLSGSLPSHRLSLDLQADEAPGLALQLAAGWSDPGNWQGRLENLSLQPKGQSEWKLAEAVGFQLSAQRQHIERLCLREEDAGLCGGFERTGEGVWEARFDSEDFPLATLKPWLPQEWRIEGLVQGQGFLSQQVGGKLLGEWSLRLSEALAGFNLAPEAEPLIIAKAELEGGIDGAGLASRLELNLADVGELSGELKLPGFRPFELEPAKQPLKGQLRLNLNDLSRLSQLSPKLLNPRGEIGGDFTVDGTLAMPRLLGSADLKQGSLDIPELGLELREIDLSLSAPSLERLALKGGLRSGKGRLSLQGELTLDAEAGFPARLALNGKRFTVANLPEAEIRVTPALALERDLEGTRLTGRIEIPFARLRPRKLPKSAVKVSSDLVLVGEDREEQRPFDPRLSAHVQVVMGDRVSFDGFGLRGKLSGRLVVIDEPKRPVIGRGRIGIKEGTYQAYGQDLSIERGFALFADSPVDNPGLDVRAVRELDQVTAGVQVSGTLKNPKIDIFSTPAMSEGDALSYLLTGRPQGEGGGESLGVAAAIRASGAGMVAEEIGRQFGLDELRLDAGSGLEEASVVAGTYLSPRLYLQYINELASRETKVRLRYDINKRLQLEAETGKTQAGDLYYTFDR